MSNNWTKVSNTLYRSLFSHSLRYKSCDVTQFYLYPVFAAIIFHSFQTNRDSKYAALLLPVDDKDDKARGNGRNEQDTRARIKENWHRWPIKGYRKGKLAERGKQRKRGLKRVVRIESGARYPKLNVQSNVYEPPVPCEQQPHASISK